MWKRTGSFIVCSYERQTTIWQAPLTTKSITEKRRKNELIHTLYTKQHSQRLTKCKATQTDWVREREVDEKKKQIDEKHVRLKTIKMCAFIRNRVKFEQNEITVRWYTYWNIALPIYATRLRICFRNIIGFFSAALVLFLLLLCLLCS